MNNTKEINLYIQDRQYIIRWQNHNNIIQLHEILQFIFTEIQTKYKLNNYTLYDDQQQQIEHNFDIILKYQNIYINQKQDIIYLNIVNIQEENVIIEKYKSQRKLEQVNYKIQTIINQNNQYRDTIQQLKDNKSILQQKSSIERSAQTYPITRNNNNNIIKQKQVELKEYTIEEVKQNDWMVIQNSVYNIKLYIDKHPGGREQIMRGIGRDATDLFMQNHPWINYHYILEQLHVGFLKK